MEILKYLVDYGVIGILIIMSIISLAIFLERRKTYKTIKLDNFKNKKELEIELTKGLYIIASVGSNAPYLGLLGTVLGIMLTFYEIGETGLADTTKIMQGLALALKATAIGLLVAIPSTTMYNYLLRRVREILALYEISKEKN
ncbi:MAG: TonB-system energizer ExbB [Caldimicrobium sp.]|jgi:biopolymer transport protein ExbB|uniref:TonB-system energizer ExbB n=1 Tax=Caldimicrobium thiodismutans TaxID=1653476 RepID=A0A2N7PLD2_9BACT|nr:MAG: TonB-system energizer ExbB [Caldimicrobium thiodismutans]